MFKVMAGVVALAAAGSVAWGTTQGVSVGEIIHGVEHLTVAKDEHGNWSIRIDDSGDEVGFVKAVHDDAAFNKFNAAEMLQMGRTTCGWLRNGSAPNEIINWMDQQPGMAGFSPVLLHKVELDFITNSQVYLWPGHAAQRDGQHDDHAHADGAHDDGGDDRARLLPVRATVAVRLPARGGPLATGRRA
jgi:hypothetical protein